MIKCAVNPLAQTWQVTQRLSEWVTGECVRWICWSLRLVGLTLVFLLPFWSYYHILVVVITSTTSCTCLVTDTQGRIQDLKKEGAQWLRGLAPNTFLAKLGDFFKNFRIRAWHCRPTLILMILVIFWPVKFGLTITLCSVGLGLNLTYSYSLWTILGLCQW